MGRDSLSGPGYRDLGTRRESAGRRPRRFTQCAHSRQVTCVTMNRPLVVQTIDYHTAGEPFRIVTGGVGPIPGATMLEKRRYAAAALDPIRQLLVNEPRGHADMYGCFVTEPVSPDGDLGV